MFFGNGDSVFSKQTRYIGRTGIMIFLVKMINLKSFMHRRLMISKERFAVNSENIEGSEKVGI